MKSKKKGGCKLVALVVFALLVMGISVMAAEPAINPAVVTTGRIVIYGSTPLKIGATELTAAKLAQTVASLTVTPQTAVIVGTNGVAMTVMTNVTVSIVR
jgi:hypothetical protein